MTATTGQVAGEDVAIPLPGGAPMAAYLVRPEGTARGPGVVVVHELFGLNDNMRAIARRFAGAGYVALAVDLYSGHGNRRLCMVRLMAGMVLRPLGNGGVKDLRTAVSWLQARPAVDRARVGVAGFCMGGGLALGLACTDRDLSSAAVFYGLNPWPLSAVRRVCPLVGSYGEADPLFRRAGRKLDERLTRYGIPHDIKIYPGAKHSFFNVNYDEAATTDAFARTVAFFDEHLRGQGSGE